MSKSSKRWLQEHFTDPYVKSAQQQGYRSRAAFKLLELQERDQVIKPGHCVVDLGAAPGGWSQVAAELVGKQGRVIALDILPMPALNDVTIIEADFTSDLALSELQQALQQHTVDVVLSDMAPNISGHKDVDQARAYYLVELALAFAEEHLRSGGNFVAKVFQGSGFDEFYRTLPSHFKRVLVRKPKSSRARSNEIYIVCLDKR
ncbi:MAG: 23S rRNA (uridine(2552)-2'-O)-methyltransferase RlmE [Legionellales bacterium]|nr:23S rRNA (uridine(2552)-2'-O)-methyltransferase RlmE [Legionellales bacterium]